MEKVVLILGLIFGAVLFGALMSFPMMLLWNGCLVPAVTVLQPVTWLQMWGITVVCSMLFKASITTTPK